MPDGTVNVFQFKAAVRENTKIVMALAGASGSGKTFSALELAMGLACDGKVAVIDTEGRRCLHYADLAGPDGKPRFRFDHCELRAPYTPERFLAALKAAEAAGYAVIVVDSFSDEYVGEGGLVDMAEAEYQNMREGSRNVAASWARPKAQHKLVVRWMRRAECHLLLCLRAEEKVRLEKQERGGKMQTVVVPIGWQPICEKNVPYEMTTSFMLTPEQPGIPQPIKLQEQHRRFFPASKPITRESGRMLGEWAAGAAAPAPRDDEPSLDDQAREIARDGLVKLEAWWRALTRDQKAELKPSMDAIKEVAKEADRELEAEWSAEREADPFGLPPLPPKPEGEVAA